MRVKVHKPHPSVGEFAIHPQATFRHGVLVGPRESAGRFVPHAPRVKKTEPEMAVKPPKMPKRGY